MRKKGENEDLIKGGAAMLKELSHVGVIVVDLQGDFTQFKNGTLSVEGTGEAYLKGVEDNTKKLKEAGLPIYATQDWHPKNHVSFFTNHPGKKAFEIIKLHGRDQVLWPPHCIQGSSGAEILLDKSLFKAVIRKGMDPLYDSYSGFQDDGGKKTEMDEILKRDHITKLVIYGLATDYCVRATALDAASSGYQVILIKNLSRGVSPHTSQKAIEEMKRNGVLILDDLNLSLLTI